MFLLAHSLQLPVPDRPPWGWWWWTRVFQCHGTGGRHHILFHTSGPQEFGSCWWNGEFGTNHVLPGNHTVSKIYNYSTFHKLKLLTYRSCLSINALCACVYIYTSGNSAIVGHPRCGLLIWLSLQMYLPYSIHFSEFMPTLFYGKMDKTQNTPFMYHTKMAADGYLVCKALVLGEPL